MNEKLITLHKYISKYPIKRTDRFLILGTIHPDCSKSFEIDFFYGHKNTLWNIIGVASGIELQDLNQILSFLNHYHIAVSDMVLECERDNINDTKDANIRPIKLNEKLKEQIIESHIDTIFFTSGFGKNNAAKLFFDYFKKFIIHKPPKKLNENREFNILFNNKMIRCVILYSPSNLALMGIARGKGFKQAKEINSELVAKQFRIDWYWSNFCNKLN